MESYWLSPHCFPTPGLSTLHNYVAIEDIYAEIHVSVKNAATQLIKQDQYGLEAVRSQNERVVAELMALEHEITQRQQRQQRQRQTSLTSPDGSCLANTDIRMDNLNDQANQDSYRTGVNQGLPSLDTSSQGTNLSQASSGPALQLPLQIDASSRRPSSLPSHLIIHSLGPEPPASHRRWSISNARNLRTIKPGRIVVSELQSQSLEDDSSISDNPTLSRGVTMEPVERDDTPLWSSVRNTSCLSLKARNVGNREVRERLREFATLLQERGYRQSPFQFPEHYNFHPISEVNGQDFIRTLPRLAQVIECSVFGEQDHRIRKRIAFAHFYHAYTLAQENPKQFLEWCAEQPIQKSMLPKGGYKSIVQSRFVDLLFPELVRGSSFSLESDTSRTKAIKKVQTWRKYGKPWARMIRSFGYGILLLLPTELTDEDLRLARDDEITEALKIIMSLKAHFVDLLDKATKLVMDNFFWQQHSLPAQQHSLTAEVGSTSRELIHWDQVYLSEYVDPSLISLVGRSGTVLSTEDMLD